MIEIAPGRYQAQPNGRLSLYRYPYSAPGQCDLVVEAGPYLRKLFFLNLDKVAQPVDRVNDKIANFEFYEKLLLVLQRDFLIRVVQATQAWRAHCR